MRRRSQQTSSKWKRGFGWRLIRYLLLKPVAVFAVFYALIAFLAFTGGNQQVRTLYIFAFPWLAALFLFLNLPFLRNVFRLNEMSVPCKMNHALEHGTIFFLRRRYGRKFKIGGRAEEDGFRVNGLDSPEQIRPAFEELRERLKAGDSSPIISIRCGSNIVTAQGYGIVLLSVSGLLLVLFAMSLRAKLLILAFNLAAYLLLRHRLGNWIQRRYFMSLDFQDACVHSINEVKPRGLERRPVFFVRTVVH
jgi:hypothetical protein